MPGPGFALAPFAGAVDLRRPDLDVGRSRVGFEPANGFDTAYAALLTDQSAHPYSQALGFAVVESAVPGAPVGRPFELLEEPASPRPATLQVRGIIITASGVHVRFNQPFNAKALLGAADIGGRIVLLHGNLTVKGRVVVDPDGAGFTFVADGPLLADGAYTIRLVSGPNGFSALADGTALDGDYDGRAGGDYQGRFSVAGAALRLGLDGSGAAGSGSIDGLAEAGTIRVSGATDWSADRLQVASDAAWAVLTGGIGGIVTLAALPGAVDTRFARRARAAGARHSKSDTAADDRLPVRIGVRANQHAAAAPIAEAPRWLAGWLKRGDTTGNDWRIRL